VTRLSPATRLAVRAARAAGAVLLGQLGRPRRVWTKPGNELATSADVAAERCIARLLGAAMPGAGFLGEEGGRTGPRAGDCWIVDPLDGTLSFVHGMPTFSVCIALARDGRLDSGVIFLPRLRELFVAERGRGAYLNGRRLHVSETTRLRHAALALWHDAPVWGDRRLRERLAALALGARVAWSHGAGFSLAYVAAGRLDGYWEQSAKPWDIAAGSLLVEEAGGRVTDDRGRPLSLDQPTILATNGHLHRRILDHLRPRRRRLV
jgi:myo-inositol-1(or 4)-monophosphatase